MTNTTYLLGHEVSILARFTDGQNGMKFAKSYGEREIKYCFLMNKIYWARIIIS